MAAMRTALAASCLLTLLAVAYLSASLLILHPPRANVAVWFALAGVLAAQSVLTLTALSLADETGWLRSVILGGAAVLVVVAAWRVRDTLTSSHFEGYDLLLGVMLAVQAALTLAAFLRTASVKTA